MSGNGVLPRGWKRVALREVADVNPRKVVPEHAQDHSFTFVPMASVHEEMGGIDVSHSRPFRELHKGYTQFRSGDVIAAKITPCMENGKIAVVPPLERCWGYGSTEFHVLRPRQGVEPKWLAYYLLQTGFRREARRNMTGTAGQLRVPSAWLADQEIPLPPVHEQARIIERIEELFSDLDAGVAALERAKANLKRYRAAVLKAAVEGKLTERWRAENPPVEPASKLLERILVERRRRWEEAQLAAYAAKGKTPPKGWRERYEEVPRPNSDALPALPVGWCWAAVAQVGEVQLGRQRAPRYHSGPNMRPYLRVANVFEDRIDLSDVMEMDFGPQDFETYRLRYGDILLNEGQSKELVGRPALFRDELPDACFTNTLIRFRACDGVLPEYALAVFLAYLKNGRFQEVATITVNIAHLGAARFASIEFPVPPLAEQKEIVSELSRCKASLDAVELQVLHGLRRASRLRQAILRRAFTGGLTTAAYPL